MKLNIYVAVLQIFILEAFVLPNSTYAAEVYKCIDGSGKIIFSQVKCSEDAEIVENAEIQITIQEKQDRNDTGDARQTNDNPVLSKWLDRLKDPSKQIREEAGKKISQIALDDSASRNQLVPILISHCRTEKSWPVITNGILFPLRDLSSETQWREQFLDLYIFMADKNDYVTGGTGYREIWKAIEKGYVDSSHTRFQEILQLAKKGQNAKYPPDNNVDDLRLYSMKILDWYTD